MWVSYSPACNRMGNGGYLGRLLTHTPGLQQE